MRTKQTGKKPTRMQTSSGATGGALGEGILRTPAVQQPLSEKDAENMRRFLDKSDKPFTVITVPLSRKRKRDSQALQIQDDLWQERLSVQYEVRPRDKWERLRKYKKFTVGSESIATGQCILVRFDDSEDAKIDPANQWKGKVLEVRALDPEHVYIRVAWLNRPEDLESSRKEYHGKNELIPTNQMDIIDALTTNGSVEVVHWDDISDETMTIAEEQYFWRQTYDFTNSKTFSKLRLICIDHTPQNPDETILQCPSEACRKWLHAKCIAEKAVEKAAEGSSAVNGTAANSKKRRPPENIEIPTSSPAIAKAVKGAYTSEVFVKGLPQGPDEITQKETQIIITDPHGEQHSVKICCLFCGCSVED